MEHDSAAVLSGFTLAKRGFTHECIGSDEKNFNWAAPLVPL
jgi:hypothetical protein